MNEHLRNKTIIITGAAGGIGEPVCRRLAPFGMNMVITGRNAAKMEVLAEELRALGSQVRICAGDLRSADFIDEILNTARSAFGGIDIIVNNAGLAHNCSVDEMTWDLFNAVMETNVRAPYFLCKNALPDLRASDCATVINICSVVAHKGYPHQSVYAASKHALLGMSKSLANEVYKDGIRVHAVSPGAVFTPMIAQVRPDLSPEGMILPEDIASIIAFLLEMRKSAAVIDEVQLHRATKEPFA